ncbi:hypothetical protein MCGE09_00069 [Thaumarchaeota archaeon SCGC AB-539-E09]|nr:hypothetical protein MCGE09_00069 [Thaumarchaeota archaeon SCGC AB-539-E09]
MDKKNLIIPILNVTGLIIIIFYLNHLRLGKYPSIYLFVIGVLLCSSSLVMSYYYFPKYYVYSLFSLFLLSYCMLTFYNFRYDILGGEDIVGEYTIALETTVSERWPWELIFSGSGDRPGRYASCLSVTILPAVLSKVMGIEMLSLFRYVMPVIGAILPLIVYILTRDVFDSEKLAILTAMLFTVGRLYLFSLSYMFREILGYIFLFMALYSLMGLKNIPLTFILITGLVISSAGHVAASSGYIVFGSYFMASIIVYIFRKGKTPIFNLIISPIYLIYYVILSTMWLQNFSSPKLMQLSTRVSTIIPLLTRVPDYIIQIISTWNIFPAGSIYASGLPVSLILTVWYYGYVLITAFGIFYSVFRYMKDTKKITLIVAGTSMFLLFLLSVLSPWNIPELQAHRVIAFPLLIPFLAITLRVPIDLKGVLAETSLKLIKRFEKALKSITYLWPLALAYLLLSLPMNLNLVDHDRILHYHNPSDVDPRVSVSYPNTNYGDITLSDWVRDFISENQTITTDFRGSLITYLAGHVNRHSKSTPSFNLSRSNFILLHEFFIKDGLWRSGQSRLGLYPSRDMNFADAVNFGDLVYSSGKFFLITRPPLNT